jgi:hypothetical protein
MTESFSRRAARLLEHPRAWRRVFLLGMLLVLPCLTVGFYADDWMFLGILEGSGPLRGSRFDLYNFASGGPAAVRGLIEQGALPWWTDPSIHVRFWRPLSSALLSLDHVLFGLRPFGYHVHMLLWYAAFLHAVGSLFRDVLPKKVAVLSFLIFAIDGTHAEAAGWLSDRHMLIAALPVLVVLRLHVRRSASRPRDRWLTAVGVAAGLSGGEGALGVVAYLVAYDIVRPGRGEGPRTLQAALLASWPSLVVLIAYLGAYGALGYGAAHSGMYAEPLSAPGEFSRQLLHRIPLLLGDYLAGLPSPLALAVDERGLIAAGLVALAAMALLYRAIVPLIPEGERGYIVWFALGALFSLVVACGALPTSRLLLLPSIGGAVLVAYLLSYGWDRARDAASRSSWLALRRAGWVFVFSIHLVLRPLTLVTAPQVLAALGRSLENMAAELPVGRALPRRVVILAASDPMVAVYTGLIRGVLDPGSIKGWNILSMGRFTHRVTRTAENRFTLRADGRLLGAPFERLFRTPDRGFVAGDRTVLQGGSVTVLEVDRGEPTALEMELDVAVDDPTICLLAWQGKALRRVALPPVGQDLVIPWSPGPLGLL